MNIAILGTELYRTEINCLIEFIESQDIINHNKVIPKDINSLARSSNRKEIAKTLKTCQLGYVVAGSSKRQLRSEINTCNVMYICVLRGWNIPVWLSHAVEDLKKYDLPIVAPEKIKSSLSETNFAPISPQT